MYDKIIQINPIMGDMYDTGRTLFSLQIYNLIPKILINF